LEEKGLIIQTSPRPVIYQAVDPKVALDMILKNYKDARNEALKQFEELKKQDVVSKPQPPIFYIFGDKNLEFKIRDMIASATEKVYCGTSEKYLKYVKKLAKKEQIKLNLILLSENTEVKNQLENLFSGNIQIQLRNPSSMTENRMRRNENLNRQYSFLAELADLDNLFLLVIDENEALIVPPLKSNSLSALATTNKAIIFFITQIFLMSQAGTLEQ
jgi:sugar-specific transcriptional regulator TrmB